MATVQASLTASQSPAPPDLPSVLDHLTAWNVLIPDRADVSKYLASFPDAGAVLPALTAEARRTFGAGVELSLEVNRDPEFDDRYLKLVARKSDYDIGFLGDIDAVNRRFDEIFESSLGYLELSTDFCRPRGEAGVGRLAAAAKIMICNSDL